MNGIEATLAVIREWVVKAENDLLNAAHTLKLGRKCPTDTVCFHAQQCAEKYLKALLVLHGVDFPKTHDLELLASRVRHGPRLAIAADDLTRLKRYATVTRYPGAEPILLRQARHAVAVARRIRAHVRRQLPGPALRAQEK